MAGFFVFIGLNALNRNLHFFVRFAPVVFGVPFMAQINHYIGLWGIQRNIDKIMQKCVDDQLADENSLVKRELQTFIESKQWKPATKNLKELAKESA